MNYLWFNDKFMLDEKTTTNGAFTSMNKMHKKPLQIYVST